MAAAHQALPEADAVVAVAVVIAVLTLPAVVLLRELVHVERVTRAVRTAEQRRCRQLVPVVVGHRERGNEDVEIESSFVKV